MVEGDQQSARAEEDRKRFALRDLRAYYFTRHKAERGALPDLHANPATTARVYDSREDREAQGQRHVIPILGIPKQKRHWIKSQCRSLKL
ncbi:hypothetical protein [Burkholderia ubonensis]|uniref:hypothetical protein n=1 Tax=Burkholderia ubonensis TaxID=101571 RepID=UPI0018E04F27|nr:hypothetical protein [Burkholderia ubonensis]